MRRTATVLLVIAALVFAAFALPAAASPGFTTVQATLVGDGDPDGSGSALLEIDTKTAFGAGTICHEIHVDNVATPITGGVITVGESGEIVGRLFVTDSGQDLQGCSGQGGIKTRDLMRIQKNPEGHFLHLYNAEHPCDITAPERTCPPGALIGQLVGVS
jgi:hypothetical protein